MKPTTRILFLAVLIFALHAPMAKKTQPRCKQPSCDPRARDYNRCDSTTYWRGNPSWQVQGYYGVMGGEPPHSYGYQQAGAYSFSMGFRRLPN